MSVIRRLTPLALTAISGCAAAPSQSPQVTAIRIAAPEATAPRASKRPPRPPPARLGEQWVRRFQALDPAAQEPFCRQRVDYRDAPFEGCSLASVGNGVAAVLSIQTECGGDSCSVRAWLIAADDRAFEIPHAGGGVEASPDGSFVVVDFDRSDGSTSPTESEIVTVRVDFPMRTETVVAPCFSAKLSPAGRWFVCRDQKANVLRFPVDGGPTELVALSGVPEAALAWAPHAYVYPGAVRFLSPTQLEFHVDRAEGERVTRTVRWKE